MFVEPKKVKKQRCFRPHASAPPPLFQANARVVLGLDWKNIKRKEDDMALEHCLITMFFVSPGCGVSA